MNKADLVKEPENQLGSRKAANDALSAVIDVIIRQVAKGEKVAITGFGTFEKAARAARTGRNPRTGATVRIKKTNVPKFRAGSGFKEVVANPQEASQGGRGRGPRCRGHRDQGRRERHQRRCEEGGTGQEGGPREEGGTGQDRGGQEGGPREEGGTGQDRGGQEGGPREEGGTGQDRGGQEDGPREEGRPRQEGGTGQDRGGQEGGPREEGRPRQEGDGEEDRSRQEDGTGEGHREARGQEGLAPRPEQTPQGPASTRVPAPVVIAPCCAHGRHPHRHRWLPARRRPRGPRCQEPGVQGHGRCPARGGSVRAAQRAGDLRREGRLGPPRAARREDRLHRQRRRAPSRPHERRTGARRRHRCPRGVLPGAGAVVRSAPAPPRRGVHPRPRRLPHR